MADQHESLRPVLSAYGFDEATVEAIEIGNINRTFRVDAGPARYILQRLNPIFGEEVHLDIEAVTAHLEAHGMLTPRLVRTRAGELWTRGPSGGVWRVMTLIEGSVHSAAASAPLCRSAGGLLGRFHRTLAALDHDFHSRRPLVHDIARHLRNLEQALAGHPEHRAYSEVEPVARAILEAGGALAAPGAWQGVGVPAALAALPVRVVHGDPKLNNIVFSAADEALCFIDLDTLGRMSIPVELGDAFRSWCNPAGEDCATARFDIDCFAAGAAGYLREARELLTEPEVGMIVTGVETVALELAARFCADALNESYFGWDHRRFGAAWEHNLLRARGQLSLARSIAAQRPAMQDAVGDVLGSPRPA